jgi:16S rRNA (guanine527-N7)-methyltransferase
VKLTPEQAKLMSRYEALLRGRADDLGLVSKTDLPRLRDRHIDDCLRAAEVFGTTDRLAYDLGSGAGLPGIVLAVARPDTSFLLVEARRRRAAFLELAAERLGLRNVEVYPGRAESLRGSADVLTARAFAPLPRTWQLARRLLRPGGRLVFFAGKGWEGTTDDEDVAVVEIREGLANQGPLVIMTRG